MNKKPVLIDISILLQFLRKKKSISGIPRVVLAYLKHYQNQCQVVFYSRILSTFVILSQPASQKIAELIIEWDYRSYPRILWLILRHGKLQIFPGKRHANQFFIKLCMRDISAPMYFWQLERLQINLIVMVHDLIPIQHPELVSPVSTKRFSKGILRLVAHATGIITVSETERLNLLAFLTEKKQWIPPSISSHLASGLSLDPQRNYPRLNKKPYFVIVGPVSDRKNHRLLLNIWLEMVKAKQSEIPQLVILGKMDCSKESSLANLVTDDRLAPWVTQHEVNDSDLVNYVYHAQALLFPSLAEGYGLPLIEALTLGTPVIANQLPVFHEIAGDFAEIIDANDQKRWLETIVDYAKVNSVLRTQQLQRLKQFVPPTWDAHFERVEQFLDTIK